MPGTHAPSAGRINTAADLHSAANGHGNADPYALPHGNSKADPYTLPYADRNPATHLHAAAQAHLGPVAGSHIHTVA